MKRQERAKRGNRAMFTNETSSDVAFRRKRPISRVTSVARNEKQACCAYTVARLVVWVSLERPRYLDSHANGPVSDTIVEPHNQKRRHASARTHLPPPRLLCVRLSFFLSLFLSLSLFDSPPFVLSSFFDIEEIGKLRPTSVTVLRLLN